MKKIFTLITFLGIYFSVFAQTGIIRGSIKTADGQPAEFVNVALKGTSRGATANKSGQYEIKNVQPGHYTLIASFIGLQSQEQYIEVKANQTHSVDFTLSESAQQLQEVVISSYAPSYKADNLSPTLRLQAPLLETPQNIQVISRTVLGNQQIFDMLEGVSRNVSGVTRLEHWDNYARINMRGSQIAAFRNGMNVQMPWGPLAEDMSVVERIEFVKGPAGFMMANGEPSGFYNIVTKKPTGINKGEANFTLGSFQTYRAAIDLDGKVTSDGNLLYRINLMGMQRGSHRDYEFNNRYTIAPVLQYNLSDRTSLTAEYTYQYSQMSAIGSNYSYSATGYGGLPKNFTIAEPNITPTDINDHSIFLTLQHQLDDNWKITSQLAYLHYNQIGSSLWPAGWPPSIDEAGNLVRELSIWDAMGVSKQGQFFVNGTLQTGTVRHRILGGLDMYHKDYFADWMQGGTLNGTEVFNIYNPIYGRVPADSLPQFDRSKSLRNRGVVYNTTSAGVYLQDELSFWNDRLRLTLAARHTTAQTINPYSGNTKDSRLTPRIGISASLNQYTSIYALNDRAFVPQPGTDFEGNAFDPIIGRNTEFGLKRDWFQGRWNSTLAYYSIVKNNVLAGDPNNPNFSIQLGETRTQGIEFDVRGELARGLNLILNYAYTDSRITDDTDETKIGQNMPGNAKHISNAWISYSLQDTPLKGFGLSLGYQWQKDRSSWFAFNGEDTSLPDYLRLDGSVSWQNERVRVALNVNNLLNEYLYSGAPYSTMYYWQTEPGRNARLNLTYNF